MKNGLKVILIISLVLLLLLLFGQTLSLFDYDLAVSLGLQESHKEIGDSGVAFSKGYAFADTVIYIPLLTMGIIGMFLKQKTYGYYSMFASLAITSYWPIACLFSFHNNAIKIDESKYVFFSILLPLKLQYMEFGECFICS